MPELFIRLFGSVRVELDGQEIPMRPASRALLLYFLLYRTKHHRREALSTLFWGDSDDAHARRCLNSAIWRLRQEMADLDRISSDGQGDLAFELHGSDRLDVAEFEAIAAADLKKAPERLIPEDISRLERAAALYSGDLAEDVYYDWVLPERERLRAVYLDIVTLVMHAHTFQQSYSQAIVTAQQLLQGDPLREDVHRHLMGLYIATGQRSRALQQYMHCWQVLHDELGLTPMSETTALYEQITGQESFAGLSDPAPPRHPQPPHLDRLKDLLNHLQADILVTLQAIQEAINLSNG